VPAEKTLQLDFFKGALQQIETRRQQSGGSGCEGIYDQIREVISLQGSLSIERMCELAQVSRTDRMLASPACRANQSNSQSQYCGS